MDTVGRCTADLQETMDSQLLLIQTLIEFAQRKEACLSSSDSKALTQLLDQEEDVVAELRALEEARRRRAVALAAALGDDGADVQLKTLAGRLSDPVYRRKLLDAGRALSSAVRRLSLQNVRLRAHLNQKRNYAGFMLNLMYAPAPGGQFYNIQGAKQDGPGNLNVLDYHA